MYSSTLSLTSALDGGVWSTPLLGRFTPSTEPVRIVQEASWAPRPVWTGAENLAPTGIRSPDRPGRSESLHRLGYPGSLIRAIINKCTLKAVFRQLFSSRWQRGRWWWQERATYTAGSMWSPRSLWWGPWRNYPMPNWQTLLLTQHTPEWRRSSITCSCVLKIMNSPHVVFQRLVYFTHFPYLWIYATP